MEQNRKSLNQILEDINDKKTKILYHGSDRIVDRPLFGFGSSANDFGSGFYCTEIKELAKEWAAQSDEHLGFCNKYILPMSNLKILNLNDSHYSILNWAAILFKYRDFSVPTYEAKANLQYLLDNFFVDVSQFDVAIGYRADDSYFSWAKYFLSDQISLEQMEKAMHFGTLGSQVVLLSAKSFDQIQFHGFEQVDVSYFYKRRDRAIHADRRFYNEILGTPRGRYDTLASDIRIGGFKNEDFCIPRDVQRNSGR